MILRELVIEDELLEGVQAISLVTNPAIDSNFIHFNEESGLLHVQSGILLSEI